MEQENPMIENAEAAPAETSAAEGETNAAEAPAVEGAKELSFNDYVRLTLESGVEPFELKYTPIVDCESGFPYAYRTETVIHSITMGVLKQPEYTYVSDKRACGAELLRHNIQHAITALKEFEKAGRNVEFLTVRCPAEMVEATELYDLMASILRRNPTADPRKICLEFPQKLLERNTERAHAAVMDMKLLKVRTALVGCGTEDFATAKLLTVPTDMVILDPAATAWAGSRNKPQLLTSLVNYVKSMGIDTIAEGQEEERKAMRNVDCVGFIYAGADQLSLEEAIAQKEAEEEE